MNKLIRYFLQGVVFTLPIVITIYVVWISVGWIDHLIPSVLNSILGHEAGEEQITLFPGVGILIIVSVLTSIGYLTTFFFAKPAFSTIDNLLYKIPVVNIIHSSTKDVLGAFVGDKKRFNSPVLVKMDQAKEVYRIGFITRTDLTVLNIKDKVAVYFPHSYNISGNLLILPTDLILPLDVNSGEIMKFIVSGGVSGLNH